MITATDLAGVLTAEQYALLQSVIDVSDVAPTLRVTLKQYAPEWATAEVPVALQNILDPESTHTVTMTGKGNWRLGYDGSNSDIYWPFQVRSFDAISLADYDIIAMVTDLPPIVDTTISEQKATFSYQRVQGIVLFKYDPTTGQWSDHRTWDVIDSTQSEARANVKLTSSGDYVYMTYGKSYGGVSGLAITRSRDGINWEDPVLMDIGTGTLPPLTAIARDGDYMYLISASSCRRSLATEYMPPSATAMTQVITDYVLSASVAVGASRQVQLELANPSAALTTAPGLLSKKVATRCLFEAGYQIVEAGPTYTNVYVPILTGDVVEWSTSEQLPVNHLTVSIKDSLSLTELMGSSEAIEWQGLQFDGDNFCPMNAQDLTGATGLRKSRIMAGLWTGTQTGLRLECDGRERQTLATFDSRVFNGCLSAEYSFYQAITAINMSYGSSGTETAVGTEYAGPMFRWLDQHNCWLVKITPAGHVSLVKRVEDPANTHLHEMDYAPLTHLQYAALHVDTVLAEADISLNAAYWHYYTGRITVIWKYGLVRVFQNYPNGAAAEIITYEVTGFGNTPYTTQATPIVCGYVGHVIYSPKDGTIELATNGDAQSGTGYWVAENLDQQYVTSETGHSRTVTTEDCSTNVIQVVTAGDGNDPGVFYRMGNISAPLGWAGGPHLEFKAHCYIVSGDLAIEGINDASVCIKAKMYYTDAPDNKPAQKGPKVWVTSWGSWVDYSWSMDTIAGKTVRRFIVSFVDQRGEIYRVGDTTFYVADLSVKQTVPEAYVYIGNVDYSDAQPVYTAHDALNALYAFSGTHLIDRKALIDEASWSPGWHGTEVLFPYVVEMDISGASGAVYLTGTSNPITFGWSSGGCTIMLGSNTFFRTVDDVITQGRLRIAVTSASSEGKTYSNDLNGICDWVTIAAYIDGRFIMSGTIPIRGTRIGGISIVDYASADIGGFRIGTSVSVANLRVDELHRWVPYFSIDPTEVASASLGRIVGITRSVSLYRFSDHVLIGRPPLDPDTANPAWTIPSMLATKMDSSYSAVIPVHFRMIGAWTEKEMFDSVAMTKAWRHFFFKKDDPNLFTTNEMDVEASYLLKDLNYARHRQAIAVRFNPLIEMGDVISAASMSWVLEQAAWSFQRRGESLLPSGSITLKRIVAVEGTPSLSKSPSASVSPSASYSPSASLSASVSVSKSPSASASPSHSISLSVSPSSSVSPSASESKSSSLSVSPSASKSPSSSTSASASPSPGPDIMEEGFESSSSDYYTWWNSGAAELPDVPIGYRVTSSPRSGSVCWGFTGGEDYHALDEPLSEFYISFWIKANIALAQNFTIARFTYGADEHLHIGINSSGYLTLYRDTTLLGTGTTLLTTAPTWHNVKAHIKIDDSTGVFEVKLGTGVEVTYSGDTRTGSVTASVNRLYFGSENGAFHYDDIAMDSTRYPYE